MIWDCILLALISYFQQFSANQHFRGMQYPNEQMYEITSVRVPFPAILLLVLGCIELWPSVALET